MFKICDFCSFENFTPKENQAQFLFASPYKPIFIELWCNEQLPDAIPEG